MTPIPIKRETEKLQPMTFFDEMSRQMEDIRKRAFDLFETRGRLPGWELDDWFRAERDVLSWPKAELKEKNGTFEMEVTLPGYEPKEIEVTATPEELVIHAATEKKQERREGERVVWSEFGSNEVFRRFALPTKIDANAVTAELDNGLLKVHVPKAKGLPREARKIPVTAS